MRWKWIDPDSLKESEALYDGHQLRSLYAYLHHNLLGDSIIGWIGPCDIPFENMVDGEDLIAQSRICGASMVHLIIEKFDSTLAFGVATQRLLASMCKDLLEELASDHALIRKGDDLFEGNRKLSISIASQSPTSTMIHFALNVLNTGTPVPTLALEDLNIEPVGFAKELMRRFCHEIDEILCATYKVKGLPCG